MGNGHTDGRTDRPSYREARTRDPDPEPDLEPDAVDAVVMQGRSELSVFGETRTRSRLQMCKPRCGRGRGYVKLSFQFFFSVCLFFLPHFFFLPLLSLSLSFLHSFFCFIVFDYVFFTLFPKLSHFYIFSLFLSFDHPFVTFSLVFSLCFPMVLFFCLTLRLPVLFSFFLFSFVLQYDFSQLQHKMRTYHKKYKS